MNIDYQKITEVATSAKQTAMGGREEIEAQQLRNLRQLVEKVRQESPLFAELYEHLPSSDAIQLQDLPITHKPELMAQFDRWLTNRTLTHVRALEHMENMDNLGVPIDDLLVYRTSGTSGEPLILATPIYALFEIPQGVEGTRTDEAQMAKMQKLSDELKNGEGTHVSLTGGNGHFAGNTMIQLVKNLNMSSSKSAFISAEQPIEKIVEQLNALENIEAFVENMLGQANPSDLDIPTVTLLDENKLVENEPVQAEQQANNLPKKGIVAIVIGAITALFFWWRRR